MLLAGDEMGRSQRGNNNAYCQDGELSWLDWSLVEAQRPLLEFARRMIALRMSHPVFRRRGFFHGRPPGDGGERDIVWLQPDGSEMTEAAWRHTHARALGVWLSGQGVNQVDDQGRPVHDDDFLILFNAGAEAVTFRLPDPAAQRVGELLVDTAAGADDAPAGAPALAPGDGAQPVQGRSLVLLRYARGVR